MVTSVTHVRNMATQKWDFVAIQTFGIGTLIDPIKLMIDGGSMLMTLGALGHSGAQGRYICMVGGNRAATSETRSSDSWCWGWSTTGWTTSRSAVSSRS